MDDFKLQLDKLYASLKNVNSKSIEKSNDIDFSKISFNDAMQIIITSNGLSLLKNYMQNNHYSITSALNIRNIIEATIIMLMDSTGNINEHQKKLFNHQYKLIEYNSYGKNDRAGYATLIDFELLEKDYDEAKQAFIKNGLSNKKFKKIERSRIPFLCDEKLNFNKIIEKHGKEFLEPYVVLSRMVHPSSYNDFRNDEYINEITVLFLKILINIYGNNNPENNVNYTQEQNMVYGLFLNVFDNYNKQLLDITKRQSKILKEIANHFKTVFNEKNYVSSFLQELMLIIHDINTDSQLGYTESVKLKFKVIVEMFACFNKVYFVLKPEYGEYLYDMLSKHEICKDIEQYGNKLDEEKIDYLYAQYKNNYPNSTLGKDVFLNKFKSSLGFFINEKGEVPSFSKMVKEFFDILFKEEIIKDSKILLKDHMWLLYKESQNMSHGNGYLFFSNTGAWNEDANIINFTDTTLLYFLNKFKIWFSIYSIGDERNEPFVKIFEKSISEIEKLIKEKQKIMTIPKVEKDF